MHDITNLVTNTSLNAKTNDIKYKIPSITNLASTVAYTTVENKIPTVSDLVKKSRLWCKNIRNGKKYFITSDCNKFMSNNFDAKITQKKLVNEYDLNEQIKTLATKEEIKTLATKAKIK